ncbi:MAG: hypothetical protein ACRC2M_25100, partial [Planktothrix sp.]
PGATEARLILTGIPDTLVEGDEVSTLSLLPGTGYTVAPGFSTDAITVTEKLVVSVTASPNAIAENGGVGTFTIKLSQPAPSTGLNLNISALDSDNAGGDVTNTKSENLTTQMDPVTNRPAGLTIAPGATEAKLILTGIPDSVLEGDEVSTVTLLAGEGYIVLPSQSTDGITVIDGIINSLVSMENPSFENPSLRTATQSPNEFFTSTPAGDLIPGWQVYDPQRLITGIPITPGGNDFTDAGVLNATGLYTNGITNGVNTAFTFVSNPPGSGLVGLQQTLDAKVTPNTRYTLAVDVGNPGEIDPNDGIDQSGFPGYQVQLLAGDQVIGIDNNSLIIAEDQFAQSTVSFTSGAADPLIGENLGIRLVNLNTNKGTEVDFDNVSLKAESVTANSITPNQALLSRPEVMLSSHPGNDLLYSKALFPMMLSSNGNDTIYPNNVSEFFV